MPASSPDHAAWRRSGGVYSRLAGRSLCLKQTAFSVPQYQPLADPGSPLRIALFTETFLPRIDGTVTRLCHTLRHLRQAGHRLLVIAPSGGLSDFEGARIHGVPGFPFPLYPELKLSIPRPSIGKVLAAFRPHLVHATHPVLLGSSAFHYSSKYGLPLVVSYHAHLPKWLHYYGLGRLEPLVWRLTRAAYNRADLVLATSGVVKKSLQEHGLERVQLWPYGVDTEGFHPRYASEQMRARLTQANSRDKLLLYVGRLSAEKNIEQCRPVLEALPGARLALVGDGPHRRKLEEHFAGTPTYFAGYMQGEELASAFASADVFFLPSRTETLGLVVLEAMASGCAVVAVAAGGITDIVQDGITGRLYQPGDEAGAIAAVRELLCDAAKREQLSTNARIDAERWGWAAATRRLETFYREVIRREEELPGRIAQRSVPDASPEEICAALQISRATLSRHTRAQKNGHQP